MSKLRNAISNCEPKIIGKAARITVPAVAGIPVKELSYQAIPPNVMPKKRSRIPRMSSIEEMPKSRIK